MTSDLPARPFYYGIVVLICLRILLAGGQPVLAIGGAGHDDMLFVRLAINILSGQWLGNYDSLTLVKGPGYPIFLAVNYVLGLPLLLSELLVYLAGGICLVVALRYFVSNRLILLILFAAYAFNPGTYEGQTYRVLREGLYPALVVIAVAAAIGLIGSMREGRRSAIIWGLLFGLASAMFWITREEGIWLLPTLAMLFAAAAWYGWRGIGNAASIGRTAVVLVLPLVAFAGPLIVVATLNWHKYGVFQITELLSGPFDRGYGALLRVKSSRPIRFLPVPRDVREAVARESPAFKSVDTYLERLTYWQAPSCQSLPETCGDFGGGWFLWAFRDAVQKAGYHDSATKAAAFYERLAKDINSACEQQRLICGPPHTSVIPPITVEELLKLPAAITTSLWTVARYGQNQHDHFGSLPSTGLERHFPLIQEFAHSPIAPPLTASIVVAGWAHVPGEQVHIEVVPASGHRAADAVIDQGLDSPDVANALQDPTASAVRFNLAVTVGTGAYVRFISAGQEVAKLPLDRAGNGKVQIEDPAVKIAIGEYRVRPGQSHTTMFGDGYSTQLSSALMALKQPIQAGILSVFALMFPAILALSLVAYLIAFVAIFRTGVRPLFWIATALLGAAAARVLLVSLADVTSMPSISVKHFTSIYPLLFTFCLISFIDLLQASASARTFIGTPSWSTSTRRGDAA